MWLRSLLPASLMTLCLLAAILCQPCSELEIKRHRYFLAYLNRISRFDGSAGCHEHKCACRRREILFGPCACGFASCGWFHPSYRPSRRDQVLVHIPESGVSSKSTCRMMSERADWLIELVPPAHKRSITVCFATACAASRKPVLRHPHLRCHHD